MIDIDKTLMPWIGKSMKVIDQYMTDRLSQRGIGITKAQWLLLRRLKDVHGESQHNLAFITNRDKASLARLLTTMEKKNLVARIPSPSDQRINRIYITSHGKKILQKAMPVVQEMIEEMQSGLSSKEKSEAINVLKKLISNIKSEEFYFRN